jgi:DNA replicative helicase MCM subunit Mcm2 (Cdc46/Mcm family)
MHTDVDPDGLPISPTRFETLIRLAEAAARMRLSDTINELDASHAIELMKIM